MRQTAWPEPVHLVDVDIQAKRARAGIEAPLRRRLARSERTRRGLAIQLSLERRRARMTADALEECYIQAGESSWPDRIRWAMMAWLKTAAHRAAKVDI